MSSYENTVLFLYFFKVQYNQDINVNHWNKFTFCGGFLWIQNIRFKCWFSSTPSGCLVGFPRVTVHLLLCWFYVSLLFLTENQKDFFTSEVDKSGGPQKIPTFVKSIFCGGNSFVRRSWHRFSGRKLPGNLVRGEFIASKPIQPVIRLLWFDRLTDFLCTLCEMESQPAPNILHDQPLNNVVRKTSTFAPSYWYQKSHLC